MEFQVILMTIVVMYIGTESIPLMMVLLWTETCPGRVMIATQPTQRSGSSGQFEQIEPDWPF